LTVSTKPKGRKNSKSVKVIVAQCGMTPNMATVLLLGGTY